MNYHKYLNENLNDQERLHLVILSTKNPDCYVYICDKWEDAGIKFIGDTINECLRYILGPKPTLKDTHQYFQELIEDMNHDFIIGINFGTSIDEIYDRINLYLRD